MKLPATTWEPINGWAVRNGWDRDEALTHALAHNEIEWSMMDEAVRYSPETRQPAKYVKISKSDQ